MDINQEFMDGYSDGHNPNAPEPNDNRSDAYRHSFAIGRAELNKKQVPPAAVSRKKANEIIEKELNTEW